MTEKKITKIGIIGCGAIGAEIARAITEDFQEKAVLHAVCDIDNGAVDKLRDKLNITVADKSIEGVCKGSDLLIEAAVKEVVPRILRLAIESSSDVVIMSVGGLLDQEDLIARMKEAGLHIYIPSGAVGGLDVLKAGMMGNVHSVEITTRKPAKGLAGAPYILENNIELDSIKDQQIIFEGSAREAISAFPKNVNVAVTISLAGIGPDNTNIRLIVSPHFTKNSHEVHVEGTFGSFTCTTENVPFPSNPKTSFLAALSCTATLKKILEGIEIGT
ncbi:MAG: aspartate dehydrogenase [Candidatus Theseobacter exili]|nr:aspartate dehydrogenase [Candidatus Theseobacter exili]